MSQIFGEAAEIWIDANHPVNGMFRVYYTPYDIDGNLETTKHEFGVSLEDHGYGLRYEIPYKDGKKHGESRGWWPDIPPHDPRYDGVQYAKEHGKNMGAWDGSLKLVINRKNGKKVGKSWETYDTGTPLFRGQYSDDGSGNQIGKWTFYYDSGQREKEVIFNDNGGVEKTGYYGIFGIGLNKIRLIEIELFSFCNRECSFCPNSFIDRHTDNKLLDIDIFEKIINELVEFNYSNYISFSRYNEPLSHRDILEDRIKYVRKVLPEATLVLNTNGDYDWKGIDIDEITVMDYDNNIKKEERGVFVSETNPKIVRKMRLGKINNRAGALDIKGDFVRDMPCFEPTYFVGIDYTGDVVPCCNIRHDVDTHKPFVLGNLKQESLIRILSSKKAAKFRKDVINMIFPDVCKGCSKLPGRYTSENPNVMNSVS